MPTKRYWLRGGVVGVLVVLVFLLVDYMLFLTPFVFSSTDFGGFSFLLFLATAFTNPLFWLQEATGFPFSNYPGNLTMIFLDLLWFCVLGSFLGWLYGKIKNRNKMIV